MAAIRLDRVHLNRAADLTDGVSFLSRDRSDNRTLAGEVRAYAGGRLRVVTRPLRTTAIGLTAVHIDAVRLTWLEDRLGEVLLFRDHRGRRVWVAAFGVQVEDVKSAPLVNVSLSLQQVTHQEAV